MRISVGDNVRVVEDVWDDNANKNWRKSEGIVREIADADSLGPYIIYVEFPNDPGRFNSFDFSPQELEVLRGGGALVATG